MLNEEELKEHFEDTTRKIKDITGDIRYILNKEENLSYDDLVKIIKLLMQRENQLLQYMKTQSTADLIKSKLKAGFEKINSFTKSFIENSIKTKIDEYQKKAKVFKEEIKKNLEEEYSIFNSKTNNKEGE